MGGSLQTISYFSLKSCPISNLLLQWMLVRVSGLTGGGPSQEQQESFDILTEMNFLLSPVNISRDI